LEVACEYKAEGVRRMANRQAKPEARKTKRFKDIGSASLG
jgi:hypothetical protein